MALPQIPQTSYGAVPQALGAGQTWADHPNRYVVSAHVPAAGLTLTSQVTEGTMSSINGTADVGLVIDGAIYAVTTPANNAALVAGLNAISAFSDIAVASNPSGSTLRVTFLDYDDHTVASYSPGTPDVTSISTTTAASDPDYVKPGMGVVRDTSTSTASGELFAVKLPSSAAEAAKCLGVVGSMIHVNSPQHYAGHGYDPAAGIAPGFTFEMKRRDFVKLLLPSSESVSKGDAAYLIYSGADAGKWRNDDGGSASQVTECTVVANNGDAVGLDIDSLPRVSVTSTASASATATLLANAINARGDLFAVMSATTHSDKVIVTFRDTSAHTLVAYSPATADVTPITNTTTAVAPTAAAVPGVTFVRSSPAGYAAYAEVAVA